MYNIEMNFKGDWSKYQMNELKRIGYDVSSLDEKEINLKYYNLARRYVSAVPRKINYARNFICPKILQDKFATLIQKIEKGVEISSHLSRNIKNIDFQDMTLNEWGIQHLHLGTEIDDDGFVNRNKKNKVNNYILFVRFTDTDAYVIKMGKHGERIDTNYS